MSYLFAAPALRAVLVAGAVAAPLLAPSPAVSTAKPRVVTIVARDYAFDAPARVPAGVTTLRLVNKGPELHHIWMVRLDEGKTLADALAAIKAGGPPPAWAHDVPAPNAPAPGHESSATVNLEPGTYALLCFIPSPDGAPHVMKGMAKELTVTPGYGAKAATLPAATSTVTFSDYDFTFSKPLVAGRNVLRVTNTAAQSHEVFIAKLAPGKKAADVIAWAEKPNGPPPGMPAGGITGVAPGATANINLTLAKGEYALICFAPDAKDGKPHFVHGMATEITVK